MGCKGMSMTHSGYQFKVAQRGKPGNATAGICQECHDELELPTTLNGRSKRVSEATTGMFADVACVSCGTNITSHGDYKMAGNADIEAVCVLLNETNLDVFAILQADKTEETVHVRNDNGDAVAKTVQPSPNANHLLHVMVDSWKGKEEKYEQEEIRNRAERVEEIIERAGLELVGGAAPVDLDEWDAEWQVTAKQ